MKRALLTPYPVMSYCLFLFRQQVRGITLLPDIHNIRGDAPNFQISHLHRLFKQFLSFLSNFLLKICLNKQVRTKVYEPILPHFFSNCNKNFKKYFPSAIARSETTKQSHYPFCHWSMAPRQS